MRIRRVAARDHAGLAVLFDAFQGELAAMDPLGRERRVADFGQRAVVATAEETGDRGVSLVAEEEDGSLCGFVAADHGSSPVSITEIPQVVGWVELG